MLDTVAIDWSGRARGARATIWLAHVRDGELVELADGRDRAEVIAHAVALARAQPRTAIGLDFSFSLPAWWCEREGLRSAPAVWAAMREHGEAILRDPRPPFWGRPGSTAQTDGEPLRATEREHRARSTFQIAGAGTVGTGAIRGMPHLETVRAAGIAIWPFDPPRLPVAVEIYPRALSGPVVKRRRADRIAHLRAHGLPARAAVSEDAFDAAVSALVMARHAASLAALPVRDPAPIEGEIWTPGVS